jgi:hypothetical protein
MTSGVLPLGKMRLVSEKKGYSLAQEEELKLCPFGIFARE